MHPGLAANLLYFPSTRLAGERVRKYLREYQAHDGLDPSALEAQQQLWLADAIRHAREHSPFYSARSPDRLDGPPSLIDSLSGLPLLEKDDVRSSLALITGYQKTGRHERKTTGGSTGHPLTVLKNRDALARERAATWRAYAWYGIEVVAPQALLWGRPHTTGRRLKARVGDVLANRLRLSMFGVREKDLESYHRRLVRFRPHYLYGYVSALSTFVHYLAETGKGLPDSLKCIVTTSELLDEDTRLFLGRISGLPVFNEYGCGEVGSIAHECERGSLHIMADNLILECVPRADLPDGLGELVVTDLFNRAMPLIRYRLGDLGRLSPLPCPCGRPYPVLERIVGRAYDVIYDADGRAFHPEAVLYVFEDLRRAGVPLPPFQAVQAKDGELLIRFQSPPAEIPPDLEIAVRRAFRNALGSAMEVTIAQGAEFKREPSGKFRVVKRIRPW